MTDRSPEHDFDFWVGEWEVTDPEGNPVGENSITSLAGTGAVAEHWHGASGVEGWSLSSWDAARGCWHQTWVDSSGGVLLLDGGLREGAMVLSGEAEGELQRISWTPGDGRVRQHWEVSGDDGLTWRTAFDGRYTRRT